PTTYISDTEFRCHVAIGDVATKRRTTTVSRRSFDMATKQRSTFVVRCRCTLQDNMVSTTHRTFIPSHLTEIQDNDGTTMWDNDDATRQT
ncbi:hypothetical protein K443DRAFT_649778, partial [Laccaria amethystina LaAM-08-1]